MKKNIINYVRMSLCAIIEQTRRRHSIQYVIDAFDVSLSVIIPHPAPKIKYCLQIPHSQHLSLSAGNGKLNSENLLFSIFKIGKQCSMLNNTARH